MILDCRYDQNFASMILILELQAIPRMPFAGLLSSKELFWLSLRGIFRPFHVRKPITFSWNLVANLSVFKRMKKLRWVQPSGIIWVINMTLASYQLRRQCYMRKGLAKNLWSDSVVISAKGVPQKDGKFLPFLFTKST